MTAADPAARGPSDVQNIKIRGLFQTRFLSFNRTQCFGPLLLNLAITSLLIGSGGRSPDYRGAEAPDRLPKPLTCS